MARERAVQRLLPREPIRGLTVAGKDGRHVDATVKIVDIGCFEGDQSGLMLIVR